MSTPHGLSKREAALLEASQRERRPWLTVRELTDRYGAATARQLASRLARKGFLQRIGKGRYRLIQRNVEEEPIPLFSPLATIQRELSGVPHYFGGPWVLNDHGLSPNEPEAVDVFVQTRIPRKDIGGVPIRVHVRTERFFSLGITERSTEGEHFLVTSKERTLIELLDLPRVFPCGAERVREFDANLSRVRDLNLLIDYAIAFASPATCQRLGVLLDRRHAAWKKVEELRAHVAAHARSIISLHPDRARRGRINSSWLVSENDDETYVTRRF